MVTDVVGEEAELYEKKLKVNQRNVVIDSFKPATSRFIVKEIIRSRILRGKCCPEA